MSGVKDAITGIRDALMLADEVKQVGESLKAVAHELRDHDRRITRLEANWQAALELAGIRSAAAQRLEHKE